MQTTPKPVPPQMRALLDELSRLPTGSLVRRVIRGKERFYHQWRAGGKTLSRYLHADEVMPLRLQMERRAEIRQRLKAADASEPASVSRLRAEGRNLAEFSTGVRTLRARQEVNVLVDFIRHADDARILLVKGVPGSGKTTLIRQALGRLTPDERASVAVESRGRDWGTVPVRTVNLTVMRYRDFLDLDPRGGLGAFLERGGLPNGVYADSRTAREYIAHLAGEDAWPVLERLSLHFLRSVLTSRTTSHVHGRNRATNDFLKVLQLVDGTVREAPGYMPAVERLVHLGLLRRVAVETLRPEFTRTPSVLFTHPGLRHCVIRRLLAGLLEHETLAPLGAAERKLVGDTLLADACERILAETIIREALERLDSDTRSAVPVVLPSGRLGLVIADRAELVCELIAVRNDETRSDEQLRDLLDGRLLDAVEHRYGTLTERTVLYRGRNARHPVGVAYRNAAKFLLDL